MVLLVMLCSGMYTIKEILKSQRRHIGEEWYKGRRNGNVYKLKGKTEGIWYLFSTIIIKWYHWEKDYSTFA